MERGKNETIWTGRRIAWLLLSLLLLAGAWLGLFLQGRGLVERRWSEGGVPLRYVAPEGVSNAPGVIVAHGFAGSQQLMLGYAYRFARAGYGVMLLDFAGHGANPAGLDMGGEALQEGLDVAYAALLRENAVDPSRIALLGHSMGSGAVMSAGIRDPERYRAVVAVSPTDAAVTETVPPNLLLQAGSLEGNFVENARDLLQRAGGPDDNFAAGEARAFVEIPSVEHITILFSATSRDAAFDWLRQAFGAGTPGSYRDLRMVWYVLNLVGALSLGLALAPLVPAPAPTAAARRSLGRQVLGLLLGVLLAIGLLALAETLFGVSDLLGMLVGGALGLWLLIAGLIWLLVGYRLQPPRGAALLWGLAFFALLWIAFGLMAQFTWLQWFLIPPRLLRWPLLALACLPWKLAAGYALLDAGWGRRFFWWLAQSLLIVGALVATAFVVPGMFILVLLAPALPVLLLLETVGGAAARAPWTYGVGSALLFGWLLAALFPLV